MLSMPSRIRRVRTAAKLSQTQLAAQVGVRRSAVAQWESPDGTSPNVEHLAQIAVTTGVYFEWLATGRGQSRPSGNEFDMAVTMQDYALNDLEGRMLELLRRLSPRKREMACSILECLTI